MKEFSKVIIKWYRANRRNLPWRETSDPYKIWLSEVILQQTRVNQGLPYYIRFTTAFPTVADLARASEETVLRLWQGLGYYSRARNLHKCAKLVATKYNQHFPPTYEEIISLPGIGPYTAAAIASIAFHEKVAVVDGNVYRVLARLFGVDLDISSTEGKKHFQNLATELLSDLHPGDHNQAVMEFGATLCTPLNPRCTECPFSGTCVAFRNDLVTSLPVKERKLKKRTRFLYYFIFRDRKKIAMRKRTDRDIWHGLYEFLLVESSSDNDLAGIIKSKPLLAKVARQHFRDAGSIRHVLSHQLLLIRFFEVDVAPKRELLQAEGLSLVSSRQVEELPKPVAITRYLSQNPK